MNSRISPTMRLEGGPAFSVMWARLIRELEPIVGTSIRHPGDLSRVLRADHGGLIHRDLLAWLGLPARCRPPGLRRLSATDRPSRLTTARLLQVLRIVAHALTLFEDAVAMRRWLSQATLGEENGQAIYPLTGADESSRRSALIARLRCARYGIW